MTKITLTETDKILVRQQMGNRSRHYWPVLQSEHDEADRQIEKLHNPENCGICEKPINDELDRWFYHDGKATHYQCVPREVIEKRIDTLRGYPDLKGMIDTLTKVLGSDLVLWWESSIPLDTPFKEIKIILEGITGKITKNQSIELLDKMPEIFDDSWNTECVYLQQALNAEITGEAI